MKKANLQATILVWIASLIIAPALACAQRGDRSGFGKRLRTHVEQDVLRKLRPFFPQAKTKIDEKGTLIILTCARNIGPLMLRKIQPEIEKQFYSAGLLAEIGLALTRTKSVEVGFEREVLVFDLSTHGDAWVTGAQIPGYVEAYPTICN
jgi:hypothetical protein